MIYNDTGEKNPVTGLELWDERRFTRLWQHFVERQIERDQRMDNIAAVVRGDWTVVDVDDSQLKPKSPNIIQVGLEDTAASAAMIPTVRVAPSKSGDKKSEGRAAKMEQLGASYFDRAGGKLFFQSSSIGVGAYGFACWNVTNDGDKGKVGSSIEWRDPVSCYPEPDVNVLGVASRMFFAREMFLSQLPARYQDVFTAHCLSRDAGYDGRHFENHGVTMLEYSDCERVTIGIAFDAATVPRMGDQGRTQYGQAQWVSVIVEDYPNAAGMCRGIYGQMPTLDGAPRGQYDQVIPVLHAHIRLVAAALEHANQSVYNELVVVDPLSSDIPQGPGAVIELGSNGKAFRLPPATVSFSFFEETQRLLDAVHVGARFPKARPGQLDQSQGSGKLMESMLGVQNAVIASHHSVFERMGAQALRVAFELDKAEGPKRTVAGTLRNQQYQLDFERDDIELEARTSVEYGLGFGRDVQSSAVLAIQLKGADIISLEDAQENYPGIVDVARTRSRILGEKIDAQILVKMLQGVQQGTLDDEALVKMRREVSAGGLLVDVFYEFVVKPQAKAKEGMLTSGLDGSQMMPGAPPGADGATPPTPPDPASILAGLAGGAPPPGGGAPTPGSRLSVPLGNGSFANSQM